ncbi:hypothetical protein KDN24_06450 [Bacillus sp. Bva_UNVM-123]|uniref:hypothetical protein n=1 Tax=Bacillus sp. Bva_UNVM-123 TaxID=2829798 RepID=UPI00391FB792
MAMTLSCGFIDGGIQLIGKDLNGDEFIVEVNNNLFTLIGKNYRRSYMPMKILLQYMEEREELSVDLLTGHQ